MAGLARALALPSDPLALRTQAMLLFGLVVIADVQARVLLDDALRELFRFRAAFAPGALDLARPSSRQIYALTARPAAARPAGGGGADAAGLECYGFGDALFGAGADYAELLAVAGSLRDDHFALDAVAFAAAAAGPPRVAGARGDGEADAASTGTGARPQLLLLRGEGESFEGESDDDDGEGGGEADENGGCRARGSAAPSRRRPRRGSRAGLGAGAGGRDGDADGMEIDAADDTPVVAAAAAASASLFLEPARRGAPRDANLRADAAGGGRSGRLPLAPARGAAEGDVAVDGSGFGAVARGGYQQHMQMYADSVTNAAAADAAAYEVVATSPPRSVAGAFAAAADEGARASDDDDDGGAAGFDAEDDDGAPQSAGAARADDSSPPALRLVARADDSCADAAPPPGSAAASPRAPDVGGEAAAAARLRASARRARPPDAAGAEGAQLVAAAAAAAAADGGRRDLQGESAAADAAATHSGAASDDDADDQAMTEYETDSARGARPAHPQAPPAPSARRKAAARPPRLVLDEATQVDAAEYDGWQQAASVRATLLPTADDAAAVAGPPRGATSSAHTARSSASAGASRGGVDDLAVGGRPRAFRAAELAAERARLGEPCVARARDSAELHALVTALASAPLPSAEPGAKPASARAPAGARAEAAAGESPAAGDDASAWPSPEALRRAALSRSRSQSTDGGGLGRALLELDQRPAAAAGGNDDDDDDGEDGGGGGYGLDDEPLAMGDAPWSLHATDGGRESAAQPLALLGAGGGDGGSTHSVDVDVEGFADDDDDDDAPAGVVGSFGGEDAGPPGGGMQVVPYAMARASAAGGRDDDEAPASGPPSPRSPLVCAEPPRISKSAFSLLVVLRALFELRRASAAVDELGAQTSGLPVLGFAEHVLPVRACAAKPVALLRCSDRQRWAHLLSSLAPRRLKAGSGCGDGLGCAASAPPLIPDPSPITPAHITHYQRITPACPAAVFRRRAQERFGALGEGAAMRQQVARSLTDVLLLASTGRLVLAQREPFGEIEISTGPSWDESGGAGARPPPSSERASAHARAGSPRGSGEAA